MDKIGNMSNPFLDIDIQANTSSNKNCSKTKHREILTEQNPETVSIMAGPVPKMVQLQPQQKSKT